MPLEVPARKYLIEQIVIQHDMKDYADFHRLAHRYSHAPDSEKAKIVELFSDMIWGKIDSAEATERFFECPQEPPCESS